MNINTNPIEPNKKFAEIRKEVNNNFKIISDSFEAMETQLNNNTDIVFGTYEGDGTEQRFINLGFTPTAVEVYTRYGTQGEDRCISGGLALNGYPCMTNNLSYAKEVIKVVQNGFFVTYNSSDGRWTNTGAYRYYFKAYRNGNIISK